MRQIETYRVEFRAGGPMYSALTKDVADKIDVALYDGRVSIAITIPTEFQD